MPYGNNFAISDRIKQVRGKKKKAEFARILGVPQPNLSKYESGRLPPADVLQKIADYGGVTVKWLLTGEEGSNLEKTRPTLRPPVTPKPAHTCEIQEFLLAQIIQAVEEYTEKYNLDYPLKYRARLISLLYNHCARELEPPTEPLVVAYDEEWGD
jgi:transcriptional regulator with XRE-family HTH domain